jgi:hypothetical protein
MHVRRELHFPLSALGRAFGDVRHAINRRKEGI